MKRLNRIVNVLTLALAVAIAVFSCLLFTKRHQLRDRGDRMATAIEKVAMILDDKENANAPWASDMKARQDTYFTVAKYPSERLRTVRLPLKPKNPDTTGAGAVSEAEAEENSKSTLYHDNYNTPDWLLRKQYPGGIPDAMRDTESKGLNLQRQLALFTAQAQDIIQQRNTLGDTLKNVAANLRLPETFLPQQFYSVKSYADRGQRIMALAAAVNRRDDLFVDYFIRIGDQIKHPVAADLRERSRELKCDDLSIALDKLIGDTGRLRQRADSFADTISSMTRSLGATTPGKNELLDEDYVGSLRKAERLAREVKEDLDKTTAALGRTKQELDDTRQQLADKERQFNELSKSFAAANKTIKTLKTILYNLEPSQNPDEPADAGANLYTRLTGKVVEVNRKWDFVVIDLGKNSTLKKPLNGGKTQMLKAPLPCDKEMYVARGGQYIAKIKIVKVDDNCSVGNVTAAPRGGNIEIGDRVFFPPQPPRVDSGERGLGDDKDTTAAPEPEVGMN